MKLPNFTILPWSETREKSPIIIICKFYKPNLSGKNIMWYTTFDQNHYKKPFISSHQFIKFFLPSPLAPFLWIYPHHNTTIKTIKKSILCILLFNLMKKNCQSIFLCKKKKRKKNSNKWLTIDMCKW